MTILARVIANRQIERMLVLVLRCCQALVIWALHHMGVYFVAFQLWHWVVEYLVSGVILDSLETDFILELVPGLWIGALKTLWL